MLKSTYPIRPAKNHDARRIYEFLCEKEEFLLDFRVFEIHYRDCIGNNDNIYLVAVDERNEAIGFISCHGALVLHQGGMVYTIQELFILGRFRKAGIGRMLMLHLLEGLSNRMYKSLEVAVHIHRVDLLSFYKNAGFEQQHIKFTRSKS
ncbi:MAG TPA: GNAT family N-acetyltransferase [Puia sp.]|nr:GNAT family N-acetyltransferase [Puia sp.]